MGAGVANQTPTTNQAKEKKGKHASCLCLKYVRPRPDGLALAGYWLDTFPQHWGVSYLRKSDSGVEPIHSLFQQELPELGIMVRQAIHRAAFKTMGRRACFNLGLGA